MAIIKSGLLELDEVLGGGFKSGNVYTLVGRPAMGKTAFAVNVTKNQIENQKKVVYFSVEMQKLSLVNRLIKTIGQIKGNMDMLSDKALEKSIHASRIICKSDLLIDDTPGISVDEIDANLSIDVYKDADLIIIDYLQLLSAKDPETNKAFDTRKNEMRYICKRLKEIAIKRDVAILVLSQLSRYAEQRIDHHPIISDIRDVSGVEEMSDVIMFLYRDQYYNKDTELKNIAEINVLNLETNEQIQTSFAFIPEYTAFSNLEKGRNI